jgi:hypothetical protein
MKKNLIPNYSTIMLLAFILAVTTSCKKSDTTPVAGLVPVVTTSEPVFDYYYQQLEVGGIITSDGGATVTKRGVCWGTKINPGLSDNVTTDGMGAGTFGDYIITLEKDTQYFFRAYATNANGTGYGSTMSFTISSFNK